MANALAKETSPYLLQHAGNPVEWHAWGPEALEKARAEGKPILLSIGYSACHWCHVMAHESFEDAETARLMNQLFVNIKVDREERPDLDKIYQTAHQLLTRRPGGWPLTMFLAPDDQTPFFGGTYFPREPRFGMPSFKEVLQRVAEFHASHQDDIRRQNESLVRALASLEPRPGAPAPITARPLAEARAELGRLFDRRHGGFGQAPKFPHPTNLELLLRRFAATAARAQPDREALDMARESFRAMALGGIYDQLGGGFCRYSVDERWMIPHFEKMLYDNGPLLGLAAELWQVTGEPLYERVARETAGWVMREMQAPEGGYYSSLDADSEGEEGKYYVWTPDEVKALLEPDEYRVVEKRYGLDRPANFEGRAWHLHVLVDGEALAAAVDMTPERVEALLDQARSKLLGARERRVRPGLDDKILTSWNGLMIKGMASAGRILGDETLLDSATRAVDFVRAELLRDGRLLATYRDGRAQLGAYLDDYALMIDAALALLEARWRASDLALAIALADRLLKRFEDRERGGFFFTANDHEPLVHRTKPTMDDALPAGNGVAARVLGRLGHLLGEPRYLEAAERALRATWDMIERAPHAHGALLTAVEEYVNPPQSIVLRGGGERLAEWRALCRRDYAPGRLTLAIPADATDLPGLLAERAPRGEIVAYVCEGHRCGPPIEDRASLEAAIGES